VNQAPVLAVWPVQNGPFTSRPAKDLRPAVLLTFRAASASLVTVALTVGSRDRR